MALQDKRALDRSRALRGRSTDAERKLWRYLRDRGVAGTKFRRQVAIGRYVVDFVCVEATLVIEVDGGQHAVQARRDRVREHYLRERGFTVLRFWNNEVLGNIDGVVNRIAAVLAERQA